MHAEGNARSCVSLNLRSTCKWVVGCVAYLSRSEVVHDVLRQCSDLGVSVSFVSSQSRSQARAVCHDKVERDIRNPSQLDLQITRY